MALNWHRSDSGAHTKQTYFVVETSYETRGRGCNRVYSMTAIVLTRDTGRDMCLDDFAHGGTPAGFLMPDNRLFSHRSDS